jgi:hypothetical protein
MSMTYADLDATELKMFVSEAKVTANAINSDAVTNGGGVSSSNCSRVHTRASGSAIAVHGTQAGDLLQ